MVASRDDGKRVGNSALHVVDSERHLLHVVAIMMVLDPWLQRRIADHLVAFETSVLESPHTHAQQHVATTQHESQRGERRFSPASLA